ELKRMYGVALRQMATSDTSIDVPSVGGDRGSRQLSQQILAEVIEPRVEELYTLVQAELRRSGFEEMLTSGIVLTGGCAALKGMAELAEEVFHMPVRLGLPFNPVFSSLPDAVNNPRYSTAIGLLLYGFQQMHREQQGKSQGVGFHGVWEKMRGWLSNNF